MATNLNDFFWNYIMGWGVGILIALGLGWLIIDSGRESGALYSGLIGGAAVWGVVIGTAMGTALNLLYWVMLVNWNETGKARAPAFMASVNVALFLIALVLPALATVLPATVMISATGILVGVAVGLLYMAIYLPVEMARTMHQLND